MLMLAEPISGGFPTETENLRHRLRAADDWQFNHQLPAGKKTGHHPNLTSFAPRPQSSASARTFRQIPLF